MLTTCFDKVRVYQETNKTIKILQTTSTQLQKLKKWFIIEQSVTFAKTGVSDFIYIRFVVVFYILIP